MASILFKIREMSKMIRKLHDWIDGRLLSVIKDYNEITYEEVKRIYQERYNTLMEDKDLKDLEKEGMISIKDNIITYIKSI